MLNHKNLPPHPQQIFLAWAIILLMSSLLFVTRVWADENIIQPENGSEQPPKTEANDSRDSAEKEREENRDPLMDPTVVAVEDPKPPTLSELPNRLGPATLTLNPQGDSITLGLTSQSQFNLNQQLSGGGVPEDRNFRFTFRRLRLVLNSAFLNDRLRTSLQLNLLPGALELMDLWITFSPHKYSYTTLRAGQFKIPFTRYRAQSFSVLSMVDWSPLVRWFGAERQIGAEVLNSAADKIPWEYALGVFTGVNARGSHAVGLTEYYGNRPVNPSNLAGPAISYQIHPELIGRVARNLGKIDTSHSSDSARGPLSASLGVSGAWDMQPVAQVDLPLRFAIEALVKVRGLYFNGVGFLSTFKGSQTTGFGPMGLMLESGYRFDRNWELALRYSGLVISNALQQDAKAYAAANPNPNNPNIGSMSSDQEFATTGNFYVIGNSLKAQLEGAWRTFDTTLGQRNNLRLTAQLQVQF